ncbi:MAG: hypothetical protein PHW13_06950 [Methylococcales bacterium]|nr:hypothetical protein [Methylococcales bacterium]
MIPDSFETSQLVFPDGGGNQPLKFQSGIRSADRRHGDDSAGNGTILPLITPKSHRKRQEAAYPNGHWSDYPADFY